MHYDAEMWGYRTGTSSDPKPHPSGSLFWVLLLAERLPVCLQVRGWVQRSTLYASSIQSVLLLNCHLRIRILNLITLKGFWQCTGSSPSVRATALRSSWPGLSPRTDLGPFRFTIAVYLLSLVVEVFLVTRDRMGLLLSWFLSSFTIVKFINGKLTM